MANTKISALTSSTTPLAGTEVLPIVQSSATVKVAVSDLTAGRSVSMSAATISSGNLAFTSTAQRITGDMSNATGSNRLAFQTSTVNGSTTVLVIPNGTGPNSQLLLRSSSTVDNDSFGQVVLVGGSDFRVASGIAGTGTYLPVTFYTNASEKLRIAADTTGTYTFGGTAPRIKGDFSNGTLANRLMFQTSTANANTRIGIMPSAASTGPAGPVLYSTSDPSNASTFDIRVTDGSQASLQAGLTGTGTYLPMTFFTGGSERMRLDTAGIVTMSAYGAGAATFSAAGVISSVSDETWKIKDGVPVDPDSMLKKLSPGYWYYNDEKKETFGVDRQLGFYAQNVNDAIGPEAAPQPEEGKPWGYYDRSVLAITVMSLQKALANIESLTARIDALEAKISA